MTRSPRAAFTLLEIILVLAVIVVLAAITYPSLDAMYGQSRLTAGGDAFKAVLLKARAQAVEDGVPYRVSITPGSGNFRAAPDLNAFWSGTGQTAQPTDAENPSIVLEDHLPKGVVFSDSGMPVEVERAAETHGEPGKIAIGDFNTAAVYLPDGTAREDYRVLLCSRGGSPLWVILRSLTGEVNVTRYQIGGDR
jgi:prepilin-type N-terminal cleavage/methylation domain-containing protein